MAAEQEYNLDYVDAAKAMVLEVFREDWMDDDEWNQMENAILQIMSYEKMSDDIATGVANGHPVEEQVAQVAAIMEMMRP